MNIGRPDLHRLIKAPRSDACAIWRPCHTVHNITPMSLVGLKEPPARYFPHLHGSNACRSDACAIGRPCHTIDRASMPVVGLKGLPALYTGRLFVISPRKPLRPRRGGGRVVRGGDACVAHVPFPSRLVPPTMGDVSVPTLPPNHPRLHGEGFYHDSSEAPSSP